MKLYFYFITTVVLCVLAGFFLSAGTMKQSVMSSRGILFGQETVSQHALQPTLNVQNELFRSSFGEHFKKASDYLNRIDSELAQ